MAVSPLRQNKMSSTIRVLGCSGGISKDTRTTSLLLDEDTLIDAGTGVGDLTLEELKKIDQVFLTHSHLDHVCSVAFLVDAVGALRAQPLKIYGLKETLDALRLHIFNDVIWPDFTRIPSSERPFITLHEISLAQTVQLGTRSVTALPVQHSIPAIGYQISSGAGELIFSGDTGPCEEFWEAINQLDNVRHLIIENSFPDSNIALANLSGHFCSSLLKTDFQRLAQTDMKIWITHLKPDSADNIMRELTQMLKGNTVSVCRLERGNSLRF